VKGASIRAAIDGDAWRLPGENTILEPGWEWVDESRAKREAVEQLVHNHKAVKCGKMIPTTPSAIHH